MAGYGKSSLITQGDVDESTAVWDSSTYKLNKPWYSIATKSVKLMTGYGKSSLITQGDVDESTAVWDSSTYKLNKPGYSIATNSLRVSS